MLRVARVLCPRIVGCCGGWVLPGLLAPLLWGVEGEGFDGHGHLSSHGGCGSGVVVIRWLGEGVEAGKLFRVGGVEALVVSVGFPGQDVAPQLGCLFPIGIGDVCSGQADTAMVEFFEQTQVDQGVVETVEVEVDLGCACPDLVALHAGADSADLIEMDLTVEQMTETRPDLVTINT